MNVGFAPCPIHGRAKFDLCESCPTRCHPLPVLMTMTEQRDVVEGRWSVTEIIRPPRQAILSRRAETYIDPEKTIYMINGTAVHGVVEDGAKLIKNQDGHIVERPFSIEIIPGYTLTGRPDYYDVAAKTLWDFKNSKAYTVKKIKRAATEAAASWLDEDYFIQLNLYRAFGFPEAEHLNLYMFVQGWTKRDSDIRPIEQISVPVAPVDEVKAWAVERVKLLAALTAGAVPLPLCRQEDLWIRSDGTPVRCLEYCPARDVCDQFKAMKK